MSNFATTFLLVAIIALAVLVGVLLVVRVMLTQKIKVLEESVVEKDIKHREQAKKVRDLETQVRTLTQERDAAHRVIESVVPMVPNEKKE